MDLNELDAYEDCPEPFESRMKILKRFRTTSQYGYCFSDQEPPKIDTDAKYVVVGLSCPFDERPIIMREDGESFCGEDSWIVDNFTLFPCEAIH